MAPGPINQEANSNPTPLPTEPRKSWGRSVAIAAVVVFFVSSAFPVTAGLSRDTESFPSWWGPLDVGMAFFLALIAFVVLGLAQGKVTREAEDASYRAYRFLTHGIMALLVAFFLFGDRIIWPNCLTGFAWRAWLLLYCLPAWFTLLGTPVALSASSVAGRSGP
jgi:hypothetical protein